MSRISILVTTIFMTIRHKPRLNPWRPDEKKQISHIGSLETN